MATRASKNRGVKEKCMVDKEGSKAETSVRSRSKGSQVKKEMINDKENTWENTMEKILQKYVTEIEKLRVEIKEERERQSHGRKKDEKRKKNQRRRGNN